MGQSEFARSLVGICFMYSVSVNYAWEAVEPEQRWEFIKENKKVRKQENTLFDQESDHENEKENMLSTKKAIKKKRKTFFLVF